MQHRRVTTWSQTSFKRAIALLVGTTLAGSSLSRPALANSGLASLTQPTSVINLADQPTHRAFQARQRLQSLEAETADLDDLDAQQPTVKLQGQVDFHVGIPLDSIDVGDSDNPDASESSVSTAARVRLNIDARFQEDDRLRMRLQSRSGSFLDPFGGLADGGNGDYEVTLSDLYYRFSLSDRVSITISAIGSQGSDWVSSTIVPYDGPAIASASAPQFYNSGGSSSNGAGVGISIDLGDRLVLDAGYTASNSGGATNPAVGFFRASDQSYILQLSYLGEDVLSAGLVYMHNDRAAEFEGGKDGATHTFAGLVSLDIGDFFIAGHGAYQVFNGGTDISWTVGIGIEDFLIDGAQLGVYGGHLPQLAGNDTNPFLIEGYFAIPVNEAVTITPALIYGKANRHAPDDVGIDNTSLYSIIRVTFQF